MERRYCRVQGVPSWPRRRSSSDHTTSPSRGAVNSGAIAKPSMLTSETAGVFDAVCTNPLHRSSSVDARQVFSHHAQSD